MSNYLKTFPLTLHSCCIECEQRRDLTKLNKRLKDEKNEITILVGVYFFGSTSGVDASGWRRFSNGFWVLI